MSITAENYDAELKMSAVVPDFNGWISTYRSLSLETRNVVRHIEYSYGRSALERLDVFIPQSEETARRVHIFFHGGYWRAFDKSDYSFIARPTIDANVVAVIANYGLMPSVTMRQLVAQCRDVIRWVHLNAIRFGASPKRISVSGHSAGAHIVSLLCLTRWIEHSLPEDIIRSAVCVSGIYDLEPVFRSFLRAETRMSPEDVSHFSPIAWVERGRRPLMPLLLAVGQEETPEFVRQSNLLAEALRKHGVPVDVTQIAGSHHMNIVLDLGTAQTELGGKLIEMVLAT